MIHCALKAEQPQFTAELFFYCTHSSDEECVHDPGCSRSVAVCTDASQPGGCGLESRPEEGQFEQSLRGVQNLLCLATVNNFGNSAQGELHNTTVLSGSSVLDPAAPAVGHKSLLLPRTMQ